MRTADRGHFDLESILAVVDRVYAAACVETPWDRAVEEVCRVGGFGGCALSSVDPLEPRPVLRAAHGLSDRSATGGALRRMPRNPLLTDDVLRSPPGTVWQDRRIMPPALLATTCFWTHWMQPNGFVSWACVILGKEGSQVVCLEVYNRASTDLPCVDLLAWLAPHLTRAWRLAKMARSIPPDAVALHFAAPVPELPASDGARTPAMIRLRTEFGLTKAEARLAVYLAAGAPLPSMAKAFAVKLTTIRSQLQQVFAKTGTSRQAELVALVLSHGYMERRGPAEPAQGFADRCLSYSVPSLQRAPLAPSQMPKNGT